MVKINVDAYVCEGRMAGLGVAVRDASALLLLAGVCRVLFIAPQLQRGLMLDMVWNFR